MMFLMTFKRFIVALKLHFGAIIKQFKQMKHIIYTILFLPVFLLLCVPILLIILICIMTGNWEAVKNGIEAAKKEYKK